MIEGYQSEGAKVDRDKLARMIEISQNVAMNFARRSKEEGGAPPHIEPFMEYIRQVLQPKWRKK